MPAGAVMSLRTNLTEQRRHALVEAAAKSAMQISRLCPATKPTLNQKKKRNQWVMIDGGQVMNLTSYRAAPPRDVRHTQGQYLNTNLAFVTRWFDNLKFAEREAANQGTSTHMGL
jgi:hypothetical protein